MNRQQMVDKLNELQVQLRNEERPIERERLKLSIDALARTVKQNVREHNKKVERREVSDQGTI